MLYGTCSRVVFSQLLRLAEDSRKAARSEATDEPVTEGTLLVYTGSQATTASPHATRGTCALSAEVRLLSPAGCSGCCR
ncbi:hypothetical protein MTO96_002530 [Rhipicephalus appendiculatus]